MRAVCGKSNVDCHTFLAVANFISGKKPMLPHPISLSALMGYLKRAHSYFLDFILPSIRRKLIEAMNDSSADGNLNKVEHFVRLYIFCHQMHIVGELCKITKNLLKRIILPHD